VESKLFSISMAERQYLKTSEVARVLNISKRTLALWVREGRIPEPEKSVAGYYLWTQTDLHNLVGLSKRPPGPQRGAVIGRKKRAA
jgi:hypothetical protein